MIQKALPYQTLAKLFAENEAHIFRFCIQLVGAQRIELWFTG